MREVSRPTAFATQRIRKDTVLSAVRLLVDENMMRHLQRSTDAIAREHLGDESCSVSIHEVDSLLVFCILVADMVQVSLI